MDGPSPLVDLRAFRRRHLGFVFQKANLIPFLNAVQNVQIALEINDWITSGWPTGRTIFPTRCPVVSNSVGVARALANGPSLILADEPTAALDSQRGRQVMELFRKAAHERGSAVIVVTHDHRALDVFDRTFEMEDGVLSSQVHNPPPS